MLACGISHRRIGRICPAVFSEVKCPVEAKDITAAQTVTGPQYLSHLISKLSQQCHPHPFNSPRSLHPSWSFHTVWSFNACRSLNTIIRRLTRNHHIMHMTFPQPSRTNPQKPRPFLQLHNIRSEEHTSELQSLRHLVCRLLLA